jgi:hypothetical protein
MYKEVMNGLDDQCYFTKLSHLKKAFFQFLVLCTSLQIFYYVFCNLKYFMILFVMHINFYHLKYFFCQFLSFCWQFFANFLPQDVVGAENLQFATEGAPDESRGM